VKTQIDFAACMHAFGSHVALAFLRLLHVVCRPAANGRGGDRHSLWRKRLAETHPSRADRGCDSHPGCWRCNIIGWQIPRSKVRRRLAIHGHLSNTRA
jgi:hypothetical protein